MYNSRCILVLWTTCVLGLQPSLPAQTIYQEGTNTLTRQQFIEQLRLMDLSGVEEYRRAILIGKAGKTLVPYYHTLVTTSKDPLLVSKSVRAILELSDDPSIYRDDLIAVLTKQEFQGSQGFGQLALPVLRSIGEPEDCDLLYPLLVDESSDEIRALTAELLAQIGDSNVLAEVWSFTGDLERLHRGDIEKLPERREELLGRGWSQATVDGAIAQKEETLKRNYQRISTAIKLLHQRIEGESNQETELVDGSASPAVEGDLIEEHATPSVRPSLPETKREEFEPQDLAVASAEESHRSPLHAGVVVCVVLFAVLCILLFLRLPRRRTE